MFIFLLVAATELYMWGLLLTSSNVSGNIKITGFKDLQLNIVFICSLGMNFMKLWKARSQRKNRLKNGIEVGKYLS